MKIRPSCSTKLTLEQLEDRLVLSIAAPTLSQSGTLSIVGSATGANNVSVFYQLSSVVVQDLSIPSSPVDYSFDISQVQNISYSGGNGSNTFSSTVSITLNLTSGTSTNTYDFDADDQLGNVTINDNVGTNTLDFSSTQNNGITLNLGSTAPQVLNSNLTLTLTSGSGIQECIGTAQQDVITAGADNGCVIHGGGGDDSLSGDPGYSSSLYADSGGCYLYATGQNMYLDGGTGNVTFVFDADNPLGSDTINPGSGTDVVDFSPTKTDGITLNLGSTAAQVLNNNLTLTLLANTISGAIGTGGTDSITAGFAPSNLFRRGTGTSTLTTRAGSYNTVYGSSGTTTVVNDGGTDYFFSGTGTNTYDFDADNQLDNVTINDNVGTNTLDFSSTQNNGIVLNLGSTAAQVLNSNLTLTLTSGGGIQECIGTAQQDVITAGADNGCVIHGGGGNDILYGALGYSSSLYANERRLLPLCHRPEHVSRRRHRQRHLRFRRR